MSSSPPSVTVACQAMATRFEIVLHGPDPVPLQAAGQEALAEVKALEAQMNLYSPSSELNHINRKAALHPVKVEPRLFALLQQAQRIHQETHGAFDITVAPLMRCWGFMKDTGRMPDPDSIQSARELVGMHLIELRPEDFTVSFKKEGVQLDLGAIGKGYAIQTAAEVLQEAGVSRALIHGGTSTVFGLGSPLDQPAWKVAIEFSTDPLQAAPSADHPAPSAQDHLLAVVELKDQAMSVSAVWGKAFQSENKTLGHVIDPRSGHPTQNAMLAAVVLPSPPETDAFSTALLVAGSGEQDRFATLRPGFRSLVAGLDPHSHQVWSTPRGIPPIHP